MPIFEEFSDLPFTKDTAGDDGADLSPSSDYEWECPHCGTSLTGVGKARVVIVGTADLEFTSEGITPEGAPGEWFGEGGFADAFAVCMACRGRFRVTDDLPQDLSELLD